MIDYCPSLSVASHAMKVCSVVTHLQPTENNNPLSIYEFTTLAGHMQHPNMLNNTTQRGKGIENSFCD